MKDRVNTYFATLLITVVGAGAAMIIISVADRNASAIAIGSSGAYSSLQQSIEELDR